MLTQNLPEYWEDLYQDNKDYWDLGKPTPALSEIFEIPEIPKKGRVLVPGAGRGWDAAEWAKSGYDTVAVDFAQTALNSLNKFAEQQSRLSVLNIDLFELNPKSTEVFDIVYEYCCFSAIHPGRRDEYFEVWERMVKPEGVVIAFFFPLLESTELAGPPHPTSELELTARLDGVFEVQKMIEVNTSIPERKGKESVWLLKRVK